MTNGLFLLAYLSFRQKVAYYLLYNTKTLTLDNFEDNAPATVDKRYVVSQKL